jgi:hypothetical protein
MQLVSKLVSYLIAEELEFSGPSNTVVQNYLNSNAFHAEFK